MGEAVDSAMNWVMATFGSFFDLIGAVILQFMLQIERFFLWIPWFVLVAAVAVLAGPAQQDACQYCAPGHVTAVNRQGRLNGIQVYR